MVMWIAGLWLLFLASEALSIVHSAVFGIVLHDLALVLTALTGIVYAICSGQDTRALATTRKNLWVMVACMLLLVLAQICGANSFAGIWLSLTSLIGLLIWGQICVGLSYERRSTLLMLLSDALSLCAGIYLLAGSSLSPPSASDLNPQGAWPLTNPNHTGVLFASALVVVVGRLSHRTVRVRLATNRGIWWTLFTRPGRHWIDALQICVLATAVLFAGSFSALLVALVGAWILVLHDHYTWLDWVTRRFFDAMRERGPWVLITGILTPLGLVAVTGVTEMYRGSEVRLAIWWDSLAGLFLDPLAWLWGVGLGDFIDYFGRIRSWQLAHPTKVLGPESELLYLVVTTGLLGVILVFAGLVQMPWVRFFSLRLGTLSRDWHARVALWAVIVVAAQALVDNTLHTAPMQYWAVMLASMALRTIKAAPNEELGPT